MIDLSFLSNMMNGDEKLVERFLSIFKTQAPQQIKELRSNIDSKDWEAVSHTAHSLKSQFNYLNLKPFAEKLEEIEAMADESRTEGINELAEEIEKDFAVLLNFPSN